MRPELSHKERIRDFLLRTSVGTGLWKGLGGLRRRLTPTPRYVPGALSDGTHPPRSDKPFGVNLIGYIRSEHGVGEACRHVAEALETAGIPWSAYDWELRNVSRKGDDRWAHRIRDDFPYAVSVFHVNADQLPLARRRLPQDAWNAYRIGIWYWEMPEFPEEWCGSFELLDEVWAPTHFIEASLTTVAPCPVVWMPPPISLEIPPEVSRTSLGLPEEKFLFLTMFDTMSESSRKNPQAVIRAFQKAFSPDDNRVGLVVKVNNPNMSAREVAALERMRGAYGNICFIKRILDRADVNRLLLACDAVCSLHRSEGLGLLCQEAMCLGKPVIATRWSGNLDFMDDGNSCLVDCRIVPLEKDCGPYRKGMRWAEPSAEAAAESMKRVFEDCDFRVRIGCEAARTVRGRYAVGDCGARMRRRLENVV